MKSLETSFHVGEIANREMRDEQDFIGFLQ